jgi:transposase
MAKTVPGRGDQAGQLLFSPEELSDPNHVVRADNEGADGSAKNTPLKKQVFKPYHQHQTSLLPLSLEELIESNHPVRIVNQIVDGLSIDPLVKKFKGGGTSSYHPRMLLKVLLYAYVNNIYSSRKIEEACRCDIRYMWLCAQNAPDHNTINRFRSRILLDTLKGIFNQVVFLLVEEGLLSLEEIYVDGTKFESAANRYTFVWKKSIKYHKEKIQQQLQELWDYAQKVGAEEQAGPEPPDFTDVRPEKVRATIEKIDAVLHNNPDADPKIKAKVNRVKRDWPEQLKKYEEQEKILGDRNSYSKTDPDATFMRMKDDHQGKGQLRPGYNLQVSTNNQCIVNYSIHPNPTDTTTLIPHLKQIEANLGTKPKVVTADAGYGSEENYEYLEKNDVAAYVKYNTFDKEQKRKESNQSPYATETLSYDKKHDQYICPAGLAMEMVGTETNKTMTGFEQTLKIYRAKTCKNCPLRNECHSGKGNREIKVNHNLNRHRTKARTLLNSEEGLHHRIQRNIDVEPPFGNIKQNHGFRRLMLRGKEKVLVEFGLLSIAQNFRKKIARDRKKAA